MDIKNMLKSVDYKGIALRHCEKAVIVIVTSVLVVFLLNGAKKAMSASDISPEKIDQLADALTRNINSSTWDDAIAEREGVKNPSLKDDLDKLMTDIPTGDFKLVQNYFKFVDFGGILRGRPDILKPYAALASTDKGAISLYQVDKKGEFIEEERVIRLAEKDKENKEDEANKTKKKARSSSSKSKKDAGGKGRTGDDGDSGMAEFLGGRMGGSRGMDMGGMMAGGGMGSGAGIGGMSAAGDEGDDDFGSMMGSQLGASLGKTTKSNARNRGRKDAATQFAEERAAKAAAAGGAGKADPKAPQKVKLKKEEVRGVRWVMVTYLFPHKEQVKKFIQALHTADDPPDYMMTKAERRELLSDGSFSDWASVDMVKENELRRRIPERWEPEDPTLRGANAIFKGLVMPMPELAAGEWGGFNRVDARDAAIAAGTNSAESASGRDEDEGRGMNDDAMQERAAREMFGSGNALSAGGDVGLGGGGMTRGGSGSRGMGMGGMQAPPGSGGMAPGMSGMGMGMAGTQRGMGSPQMGDVGMAGGRAGTPQGSQVGETKAQSKVQQSNAETVQIRFIDYTVEPEHTYQYRLKVVVKNPNHKRIDIISDDVAEDETLESKEWSEHTPPVFVPNDNEYYVLDRTPTREEAKLQVHTWLAELGDWQFSDFIIKPGDPIGGEVKEYPFVTWDDRTQKKLMDFSTREILLDVSGGKKVYTFVVDGREQMYTEPLPAEIFVIDRLGDLATRNQDFDFNSADRKEREAYIKDLRERAKENDDKESSKKATSKTETGGKDDFGERVPSRKGGAGDKD